MLGELRRIPQTAETVSKFGFPVSFASCDFVDRKLVAKKDDPRNQTNSQNEDAEQIWDFDTSLCRLGDSAVFSELSGPIDKTLHNLEQLSTQSL